MHLDREMKKDEHHTQYMQNEMEYLCGFAVLPVNQKIDLLVPPVYRGALPPVQHGA